MVAQMKTTPRTRAGESSEPEMQGERLGRLRLFSGLPANEVADIVHRIGGVIRRFEKGETVVLAGTKAKWVIPVLSGRLGVYEPCAGGECHLTRIIDPGGLFGLTLVTANLESYPGTAVADTPCEVVFFDITRINDIWREGRHPRFFENLYTSVSGEVLDGWRKLSILSCRKTEDRFILYLRWRAAETGEKSVRLPFVTSDACAQFLGVTRTALSLAIGRLVARGEIARPSRGVFVLLKKGCDL